MIPGNGVGGVGSQCQFGAREGRSEPVAQVRVLIVQGANGIEGGARDEAVVAEMRRYLEVPGVPGEAVIAGHAEEVLDLVEVADLQPAVGEKFHLRAPTQTWLHAPSFGYRKAPPI